MVVADEDVAKLCPAAPAFAWIYDITDETTPMPIATFQVAGPRSRRRAASGDDRLSPALRAFHGTVIPFAWFAQGCGSSTLPIHFAPSEVGHFRAGRPPGARVASSNDVTIDDRGLIYLFDRIGGVDIIETTVL